MQVACQCGAVTFKTPTPKPLELYHCHCSQCQKQSASAFGTSAIFPLLAPFDTVPVEKKDGMLGPANSELPIGVWSRATTTGYTMDCWFCKLCGSRLVHSDRSRNSDGEWVYRDKVSIKGGCVEGLDWHGGKHIYCESMVAQVIFPKGVETYLQDDDGAKYVQRKGVVDGTFRSY